MISLFLLPFRGLIWLFLGAICSLPWLIIVGPATVHLWLPYFLSYSFEKQTSFPCKIGSADVKLLEGKFILKDVTLYNSKEFSFSDFLKINKIEGQVSLSSLVQSVLHLQSLNIECENITALQQERKNNIQELCDHLNVSKEKGLWIESLKLTIDGYVCLRSFINKKESAISSFKTQTFTFPNLCSNIDSTFKQNLLDTSSFENVYDRLNSLFSSFER